MMTRLYTGPDGQTHFEEVEAKFTVGNNNEVYKLMAVSGAELHRATPGTVIDWHTAPRRQYSIDSTTVRAVGGAPSPPFSPKDSNPPSQPNHVTVVTTANVGYESGGYDPVTGHRRSSV
jgi:hypothetical protein